MSSTFWLLDRSRVVDGRSWCQRARALGYHLGPNGYGIAMKATRLPLMTGIAGHNGLAPILQWCIDHDGEIQEGIAAWDAQVAADPMTYGPNPTLLPVPTAIVRSAVQAAQQKYAQVVAVRGFAYLQNDPAVQELVREQNYLIEGMIWAWCLEVLPEVLRRCRILEGEWDDTYVFDCTCGLGDGVGTLDDHQQRDCQGKGLMCRPDFLTEVRSSLEVEYHEFKTTGMDSITWRDKWEVAIQLFAATLDAERRLGRQIQSIYVHGLIKGKREGDYNWESGKRDGTIRQSSIFCYGYRKPGNPPMEQEQWAAQYEWFDEFEQRVKRLPKAYRKAGVWELPDALVPEGMSKAEFWVKWIPAEARRKSLVLLGPFSRQEIMVPHFLDECTGEEDRWQEGLWQLYDFAARILETPHTTYWQHVWPHPDYQQLLDRLFPRSYDCRRYGMRHRCQFETICFYREGWSAPVESGLYVERRPHHRDELEQAIGRGLLLPEAGAAEDIDWDE